MANASHSSVSGNSKGGGGANIPPAVGDNAIPEELSLRSKKSSAALNAKTAVRGPVLVTSGASDHIEVLLAGRDTSSGVSSNIPSVPSELGLKSSPVATSDASLSSSANVASNNSSSEAASIAIGESSDALAA